ncbi:MAG: hypothetical protein M3153_06180 [Chloroflexota bacterium]|nr:hypothetical protein [Chloroflexota bacterium]
MKEQAAGRRPHQAGMGPFAVLDASDHFMTLACSSVPSGSFDPYLICGPALVL